MYKSVTESRDVNKGSYFYDNFMTKNPYSYAPKITFVTKRAYVTCN